MTAYRKFRKWNIGFRNRERLFPVLPIVIKKKNADPRFFWHVTVNTHIFFFGLISSRSVNKHGCHRPFLFLIGWFLKKTSPLKPLDQMNQNLVGSIYWRSSIKFAYLVPIRWQTWLPQAILVSDWLISEKSSPLKPLSQMNWNLVESIYGRFSIKIAHLVPIC